MFVSDAMKYCSARKYFKRRSKSRTITYKEFVCEAHCVNLIWRKLYLNSRNQKIDRYIVSKLSTEKLNQLRSLKYSGHSKRHENGI